MTTMRARTERREAMSGDDCECAGLVALCGSPIAAALELALAQFRRYQSRLEHCTREAIRCRERRDAHPRVPAGPLRGARERDFLRAMLRVVEARERLEGAYECVEQGARTWAKQ